WSSDVCSSDLEEHVERAGPPVDARAHRSPRGWYAAAMGQDERGPDAGAPDAEREDGHGRAGDEVEAPADPLLPAQAADHLSAAVPERHPHRPRAARRRRGAGLGAQAGAGAVGGALPRAGRDAELA